MLRKTSFGLIAVALAWALIGAQAASAEPNICVAAGGEQRIQLGNTDCYADGTGSVAIARAANSEATASGGDHNRATASGDGSYAIAFRGDYNTATASGDGSTARARGDYNTATASGDGSTAYAFGDNNTATASGYASSAEIYGGDNNTLTAATDYCGLDLRDDESGQTYSC